MDRREYIEKLKYLLQDISDEERNEAIEFYENYFDEAGKENEQKVIEELGEPEKVAAIIKAGLNGQFEENMSSGNDGFYNHDYQRNYEVVDRKQERKSRLKEKWDDLNQRDKILLIVLLVVAVIPVSLGMFGSAIGFFIAAAVILLMIAFLPWIASFVLFIIGAVLIVLGIIECFTYLGSGFICLGAGIITITIASLLGKFASQFFKNLLIPFINKCVDSLSHVVIRGGKA